TITSQFATTVIEGTGVRLEVDFHQGAEDVVRVEYRLHNTGDADLAVFDRGDRHAVMTGRMETGEVGQPLFRDEGEGDYTFGHVALPLREPAPTLPPVPLAAKLPAGGSLEGAFELSVPGEVPRRVRWCIGMAPMDGGAFDQPEQAGGVEVWRASFDAHQHQRKLCTPWYDMAAGGAREDDGPPSPRRQSSADSGTSRSSDRARWSELAAGIAQAPEQRRPSPTRMWSIARCGRQLGKVGTTHSGGCRRVLRNSACTSGRSSGALKSPISTALGWSCSSSAMKASWEAREFAPSERCATATSSPWRPSPKRPISTPRPEIRPGNGWWMISRGSSRLSSALALEATPPTRRLGWWLQ